MYAGKSLSFSRIRFAGTIDRRAAAPQVRRTFNLHPETMDSIRPLLIVILTLSSLVLLIPGTWQALEAQTPPTPGTVVTVHDDVTFRFGGVIQPRLSWTRDHLADEEALGFGIRRYRLYTLVDVGDRIGLFAQLEGGAAAGSTAWIDLEASLRLDETWDIYAGRIIGPQPRAYALTLLPLLDGIDRPVITVAWANRTLGADGRTYGAGLRGRGADWEARAVVHSGTNQRNIRGEIADERPARPQGTGLATAGYLTWRPAGVDGLELGGHVGYNRSRNALTRADGRGRAYTDGSLHLYWGADPGSQPVRVKAEAVGIAWESLEGVSDRSFAGVSVLGALGVREWAELMARIERMQDSAPGPAATQTILMGGVNLSRSAATSGFNREKLTIGWSVRQGEGGSDARRHQLAVQGQVVF
ncbi:MAG: hypothetical protein EA422_01930 [Gemmatimonadales bacterium]|nr:MAG: hypothetical protein EA422_01930 [Gemmatimonadales bacterium]